MEMERKMRVWVFATFIAVAFSSCNGNNAGNQSNGELPILGNREVQEFEMEGKTVTDTVYHKIADFSFTNQEGKTITNASMQGKVYVADFFFTTCPTICPIMKTQMLRVYEKFKDEPRFQILSHTLDPVHDTPELLKDYASKIGVEDDKTWHFLSGDQEKIFEIGQTSYLTTAMADQNEPGGILHSGAFVLIDQDGHIRGVYDGTKEDQVDRLMKDIPKLLK
ncbi:SCO family protein [Mariniradius sediminis]|uniref:SCO family protein n=1 Tax=Mariniradius sediminis TaxID=2909237 RepID=A0ABS9BRF6_9BACT|nr:SCO family protein [Mariniradius sediminis]MCF1749944.1 SCO family protein [Mariniradius sediminis]